MGDRCWLRIRVRKEDMKIWNKIFGDLSNCLDETEEETDKTLTGVCYEANYGWTTELTDAAVRGCVFEGESAAGDGYGPSTFAGFDGDFFVVDTGHDGGYVVALDEDTISIPPAEKERLRKSIRGIAAARKALNKLEKQK